MARRELEEINAGSMADIAFLLLIFFIVTTTMDLEAGIPKTLPMTIEVDIDIPLPDVRKRDIFSININANDQLLIEDKPAVIEELNDLLYYYYTANLYNAETDPTQVEYQLRDIKDVKVDLAQANQILEQNPEDIIAKSNVAKLEKSLLVCNAMPDGKYMQINETAAIQLKQKAGTSYGIYIAVQNEIGKVVKKVKDEKCKEIFNGIAYSDLDPANVEDQEKIKVIDILIPNRLLEPKITN